MQREIEMKTLDIIYLKENVDIYPQLLSRSKWITHFCTAARYIVQMTSVIYKLLVSRKIRHINNLKWFTSNIKVKS